MTDIWDTAHTTKTMTWGSYQLLGCYALTVVYQIICLWFSHESKVCSSSNKDPNAGGGGGFNTKMIQSCRKIVNRKNNKQTQKQWIHQGRKKEQAAEWEQEKPMRVKKIEKDKVKTNKQTNTERYPFKIKEESTEMCKILSWTTMFR